MLNLLFQGSWAVYFAFATVAVTLLLAWWKTRKRGYLIALLPIVALVGLYALLDYAVETDTEQVQRKLRDMVDGVKIKKLDQSFQHISDQFRTPQGLNKQDLQQIAQAFLDRKDVEEIVIWDVQVEEELSRQKRTGVVSFAFKFYGDYPGANLPYRCEATFHLDPDDQWRLKGFKLFQFGRNEEIPVPF